jgi:excisionase family DNA binding protein
LSHAASERSEETIMNNETSLDALPDILTVDETARFLRIGRSSVYEALRLKIIPSVRIGRRILIPKKALRQVIEQTVSRP